MLKRPFGITKHIDLTDKEVAGVIDHADSSVTDGKIASGVGLADTEICKLPVGVEGQALVRGAAAWGAGSAGIAGVRVRKNSQMPILGTRPQLNFLEGAAIDLNLEDNPPDDEIDITVSAKYPTRFMTLIPSDASLPTTNPAGKATVDGTNFAYDVLDFNPTTEESANWEWYLTPDYLSENIVVDIYWITTDADDAHNAVFGFSVLGREKGEAWDAALGAERTVVCPNGGAGILNKARITTFSPGWSPSDVTLFKLARKAADGSDDVDQDARVDKVVVSYTGQFAQSFYPLAEPVDITPVATGVWTDVDVSAYIPTGATGVMLHIENTAAAGNAIGVRKKGSTDNRTQLLSDYFQIYPIIGVDENRKFQVYRGSNIKVYLLGYTATGVVFFDNAYDKTVANHSVWETIDCSAECPGAIGIIVEVTSVGREFGLRHFDSTDDRLALCSNHAWAIIGCDASQRIKGYVWFSLPSVYFHIVGYVTQGAVFKTNGVDKSLTPVLTWEEINCSTECPSGILVFMEVVSTASSNYSWGLCKKGLADAKRIYRYGIHQWALVPCDSAQKLEGAIANTAVDWWIIGYATWAGA